MCKAQLATWTKDVAGFKNIFCIWPNTAQRDSGTLQTPWACLGILHQGSMKGLDLLLSRHISFFFSGRSVPRRATLPLVHNQAAAGAETFRREPCMYVGMYVRTTRMYVCPLHALLHACMWRKACAIYMCVCYTLYTSICRSACLYSNSLWKYLYVYLHDYTSVYVWHIKLLYRYIV